MKTTIYTIGHSTRTIKEFIEILIFYKIKIVVDIRTIAGSNYNPQYDSENLRKSLEEVKIEYIHIKALGGLRHTTNASENKAWENLSFRGYADYMQTGEFTKGLNELIKIANKKQTVIMCAEAVPWRCHRSLVGDALIIRGIQVEDIMKKEILRPHKITSFAKVAGDKIYYPKLEE